MEEGLYLSPLMRPAEDAVARAMAAATMAAREVRVGVDAAPRPAAGATVHHKREVVAAATSTIAVRLLQKMMIARSVRYATKKVILLIGAGTGLKRTTSQIRNWLLLQPAHTQLTPTGTLTLAPQITSPANWRS